MSIVSDFAVQAARKAARMAESKAARVAEADAARAAEAKAAQVAARAAAKTARVAAAPKAALDLAVPVAPKSLAAKTLATPKSPTQSVSEEFGREAAIRARDALGVGASLDELRAAAANLQGAPSNRFYQPENDLAARDFDFGAYGMRKTIDAPRLHDLDVERQRWLPETDTNTLQLQDLVGVPIMTGMADRTPSGSMITRLGPTDLDIPIHEHGGQDYMRDNPFSWGVSTKTMGSNFLNTARRLKREFGVNPLWVPWRMQGSGSDFAKTTGEAMMSHANSALGANTRNDINRFIKDNYIPGFSGINDPRGYQQFGELAGPQRKAMEQAFSDKFAQEGALSLPLTRAIITDPNQLDRKAFHLQNVAEIDPDADIVVKAINPTYHYNTPGQYKGTLAPELMDKLNVAELIAPTLRDKYANLGDLSVFRGQNAPVSPESWARQQDEYANLKADFDAKLAAGISAKAPRVPVPVGNTNKYMQSVFATGFLDDAAAQALHDKLAAGGAYAR